ncbi:hypothetical protein C8F04DRAFT_1294966, partial [Mycena alexandri]
VSRAFTLSLPAQIDTGAPVSVQWVREIGDPTSLGLMQRSLQGNQGILSVTAVPNSAGTSSGTATVVFETAGQVLLAGIQQQSLASGETPNQLSAGKQVTVIAVDDAPVVPISSTSGSSPLPTTETSSPSAHPVSGGIIIAVILVPLLLLFIAVVWVVRRQRRSMWYRLDPFSEVWTRRRRASAGRTLANFNFMAAHTPSNGGSGGGMQVFPVAPRPQQKLWLMVDHLTQLNATLDRERQFLAPAPLPFSATPVQEPPPVYAEAVNSVVGRATRLKLNKRVGSM